MTKYTAGQLKEARAPIASLISKSEKAQQKIAPGTWQHRMLRENLAALHVASAMMNPDRDSSDTFPRADLEQAVRRLESMIVKAENAQARFPPGISPHTLLRNRIRAFRIAEALIGEALDVAGA